jgi:hypothetical protein
VQAAHSERYFGFECQPTTLAFEDAAVGREACCGIEPRCKPVQSRAYYIVKISPEEFSKRFEREARDISVESSTSLYALRYWISALRRGLHGYGARGGRNIGRMAQTLSCGGSIREVARQVLEALRAAHEAAIKLSRVRRVEESGRT